MRLFIPSAIVRKGILLFFVFLVIGGYAVHEAVSSSTGEIGASKTGCGSGGGCHSLSKSASTVVTISSTTPEIVAGKTYIFSLSVKNSNGIQQAAGCDISIDNGTNGAKLAVNGAGSGLQFAASELTHTSPRVFTGDSAVWTFKYTAPKNPGTAHIYAAGNAVNLNGINDFGDLWNTTVSTLTIVSAASVTSNPESTPDISVSPNPSSGRFTISPTQLEGPATIEVVDGAGREVFEQQKVELRTDYSVDLRSLPSGTYLLWVRPQGGQPFERKIVIEK